VIRRDLSEERAPEATSALRRATIAPVDESLALEAADVSLAHGLAMANSLVYATARRFGATLVTGDTHFEGLPDAVVVRCRSSCGMTFVAIASMTRGSSQPTRYPSAACTPISENRPSRSTSWSARSPLGPGSKRVTIVFSMEA